MRSGGEEELQARAYCKDLGLDPDEMVRGKYVTDRDWFWAPRWNWYCGANLSWRHPPTGFQRAVAQQQAKMQAALARQRPQKAPSGDGGRVPFFRIPLPGGVTMELPIPPEALAQMQAQSA